LELTGVLKVGLLKKNGNLNQKGLALHKDFWMYNRSCHLINSSILVIEQKYQTVLNVWHFIVTHVWTLLRVLHKLPGLISLRLNLHPSRNHLIWSEYFTELQGKFYYCVCVRLHSKHYILLLWL